MLDADATGGVHVTIPILSTPAGVCEPEEPSFLQQNTSRLVVPALAAGMVIVADGTQDAAERLSRVLRNDPGMGVIRHADAGYEVAKQTEVEHNLNLVNRLRGK